MKTLFIGNGLNYLGNEECTWENLIKDLIKTVRKEHIIGLSNVPFPILYEEIFLRGLRFNGLSEDVLLNRVIEKMSKMKPNGAHKLLVNSKVDNIITTNYDYNIEKSLLENFIPRENIGNYYLSSPEKIYRLHTYHEIKEKKIWHIHGEIEYKKTIMLGQDKYSNSLSKIINYSEKNIKIPVKNFMSWIDLFFTTDVHIIGFRFDFSEIDLWWIINYRAKLKFVNKYRIENKIVFHVKRNTNEKKMLNYKNINRLLDSHDVIVKEYDESYDEIYKYVIKEID